jgi:hypothetical protein
MHREMEPQEPEAPSLSYRRTSPVPLLLALAIGFVAVAVMIFWNFWIGLIILAGIGFVGVVLWLWLRF